MVKKDSSNQLHIEALTRVSKAISSDLVLEDILKLIVTVIAEVLNSKICSIQLLDEKREFLEIRAAHSMSEEYNRKPPLKITEGIAGKVARENQPQAVYDVLTDKEYKFKDIARSLHLRSLLCVPLSIKNRVIGVINCYTTKTHRFTATEIAIITSIANQAAICIENADLLIKAKVFQEELQTRKLVERAKEILMDDLKISGDEALRKLQKQSMDSRKSIRELAEAIILSQHIRNTKP